MHQILKNSKSHQVVFALFVSLMLPLCGVLQGEEPFVHVKDSRIHNLFRVDSELYSGAGPEKTEDFEALKALGVRTILSVDGAAPDVEMAKKYSLRYVHIPVLYSGFSEKELAALTEVTQQCEGPIFVHCHHGKHRGPSAAAVCAMSSGKLTQQSALEFMAAAGTGKNYRGLWETIRQFDPKLQREHVELKESVPPEDLIAAMIRIEQAFAKLKHTPSQLSQAERNELVTLLVQEFAESARLRTDDQELKTLLLKSSEEAEGLIANQARHFEAFEKSCSDCHAAHRN